MISENLVQVKRCIIEAAKRVGRDPLDIRLLAVTKEQNEVTVAEGVRVGMNLLGENKIQEARNKIESFGRKGLEWHFIGRLQKNKVKFVFGLFDLIHSVDSLSLAEAIHKKGREIGCSMPILLQVNISGEESKLGIDPLELSKEIHKFAKLEGVKISGLMTIPPFDSNPENSRSYFTRLRELRDTCSNLNISITNKKLSIDKTVLEEGDWITLNGSNGHVYKNKIPLIDVDLKNNKSFQ